MADSAQEQATKEMPPVAGAAATGPSPAATPGAASGNDAFAERPELFVGAAFAGGIVLAKIVKRFGR